jgi:hypothetical protein
LCFHASDAVKETSQQWQNLKTCITETKQYRSALSVHEQADALAIQQCQQQIATLATNLNAIQLEIEELQSAAKQQEQAIRVQEAQIATTRTNASLRQRNLINFMRHTCVSAKAFTDSQTQCRFGIKCYGTDNTGVNRCPFFHSDKEKTVIHGLWVAENKRRQEADAAWAAEQEAKRVQAALEADRETKRIEYELQAKKEAHNDQVMAIRGTTVLTLIALSTDLIPVLVGEICDFVGCLKLPAYSEANLKSPRTSIPLFRCQVIINKPPCKGITSYPLVDGPKTNRKLVIRCARCSKSMDNVEAKSAVDQNDKIPNSSIVKFWWRHAVVHKSITAYDEKEKSNNGSSNKMPPKIVAKASYSSSASYLHLECAQEWNLEPNSFLTSLVNDAKNSQISQVIIQHPPYTGDPDRVDQDAPLDTIFSYAFSSNGGHLCLDDCDVRRLCWPPTAPCGGSQFVMQTGCTRPATSNFNACACDSLGQCKCGTVW